MRIYTKGKTKEEKRAYYREYMRERRESYKEHGQCVQCGKPREENKTLCSECLKKQVIAQSKYDKGEHK